MTIRQKVGTKMSLAAGVGFVAAFLPWGAAQTTVDDAFGTHKAYLPSDAWTSGLVWRGLPAPNFLPVLVAVVLAAWSWRNPRLGRNGLAPGLALYGALHSLFCALTSGRYVLKGSENPMGVSVGPALLFGAFVFMLIAMTGVPDEPGSEPMAQGA